MNKLSPIKRNALQGIVIFLLIAAVGVIYIRFTWIRFENEQVKNSIQIARSIAATMPGAELKALRGNPGDLDKPEYQALKNKLKGIILVNPKAIFAYLYTERNGKIFLVADSEPEDLSDYAPPRPSNADIKSPDNHPFWAGKLMITKPVSNTWGTWRSICVPVMDAATGKTIAVFGMDYSNKSLNRFILFEIMESFMLFVIILLASIFALIIHGNNKALKRYIIERKQHEDELHAYNSRMDLAMSAAGMAWWEMDISSGNVVFDERKASMLGHAPDKFKHYQDFMALVHPEDQGKTMHAMQQYLDGISERYEVEYRIVTHSGQYKWYLDIGFIEKRYPDGKPLNVTGLVFDITTRKLTEIALRESERSKAVLLSNLPGIAYRCRIDPSWTMEFVSDGFLELTGYQKEAILKNRELSFNDLILPEYREDLWLVWQRAVLEHKSASVEYKILTIDKQEKYVWEQGVPIYNALGEAEALEGWIIDITERKMAEIALHESEALYSNLVLKLPDGVYKSTHDGKFVDVNPAMVKMLGYQSKDELMAIDIKTQLYFEPGDRESLVLQEKQEEMGVYRLRKKDGSEIWVEDNGWYIPDENGNILFHEGVIRDITDRKRAQDEIILLNAELEQRVKQRTLQLENANRELEAFSYSVAHNLRSPLRAIDGWSLAFLEDYDKLLNEQGRHYLARVRNEAQQMGLLIDNLQELSRVSRAVLQMVNVDTTALMQPVIDRITKTHPERQFEFSIEPGIWMYGDPSMLRIALANLIDNACKFSMREPIGRIAFGKLEDGGKPTYFIRDNGVGFDMQHAKNLFVAFHRIHKQKDFPGTGIGLAIVDRIISRHGGRIWVESKPGEGTTVFFTIS